MGPLGTVTRRPDRRPALRVAMILPALGALLSRRALPAWMALIAWGAHAAPPAGAVSSADTTAQPSDAAAPPTGTAALSADTAALPGAGPAGGGASFEARRARMLAAAAAEEPGRDVFVLAAKLRTGTDVPRALAAFDSLTRDEAIPGMFYAFHLIGSYLHVRDLLPDSLHRKVRDAYRHRTMIRGDTENHWLMYYTGLYLAAQTWPGLDGRHWFNGKGSAANAAEAGAWLRRWIGITTTRGQGEYDSPTYFQTFAAPMLALNDFAEDPSLKKQAGMMLDLLFADFAAEHLRGNYGGGHSRDYPQDIVNPLAAPSTKWAWLYFGEPDFEPWTTERFRPRHPSWETVFGALGAYRIPEVVRGMATDRRVPYVHTETKRTRDIMRFGGRPGRASDPVYKYTYVTADYVLGSLQGGITQPSQQHTWDVTFATGKPNNTLFTLHPSHSGRELAMFFPEERKVLEEEVNRAHGTYTDPRKWNSSSPYEQVFQHRNALIVLYAIAPGALHPHVDGFFPKTLDERAADSSGWIFCRAGRTYVAFFPLKPYAWIEEEAAWRWRSRELRNGAVVEVGTEAGHGSFAAFRRRIRAGRVEYPGFDSALTVAYRTTGGVSLRFTYGGERLVDGRPVDFAGYRAFDGPFLRSESGSGVFEMTGGNRTRRLDFPQGTVVDTARPGRE